MRIVRSGIGAIFGALIEVDHWNGATNLLDFVDMLDFVDVSAAFGALFVGRRIAIAGRRRRAAFGMPCRCFAAIFMGLSTVLPAPMPDRRRFVAVVVVEVGRGRGTAGAHLGAMLGQQSLPIGNRNLVVIRMNFVKSEEAVAPAAVVDEGRLQRRLYADDFGEIDISLKLPFRRCLDIKFLETRSVQHDHTGLFRVRRIDQHTLDH